MLRILVLIISLVATYFVVAFLGQLVSPDYGFSIFTPYLFMMIWGIGFIIFHLSSKKGRSSLAEAIKPRPINFKIPMWLFVVFLLSIGIYIFAGIYFSK